MSFGDRNTASSSLLRKIPQGNLGQDGDCDLHTRLAKFQRKHMVGDNHGEFDEYTSPCSTYYPRIPRPQSGRIRTSGPVGPEPDFSIRASDLSYNQIGKVCGFVTKYNSHMVNGPVRRPPYPTFIPRGNIDIRSRLYAEHRPKAGHYRTREMSDAQVLEWTEFAMRHGVKYKGSRSYDFSQATRKGFNVGSDIEKLLFKEKKAAGILKSHGRSPDSNQARSAARRPRTRIRKTLITVSVERGLGSRKKNWKDYTERCRPNESFKGFLLRQHEVVVLQTHFTKSVLPEVCIQALDKMYSHPIVSVLLKERIAIADKPVIGSGCIVTDTPLDRVGVPIPEYTRVKKTGKNLDKLGVKYRIDAGNYYNIVGGLSVKREDIPEFRNSGGSVPAGPDLHW